MIPLSIKSSPEINTDKNQMPCFISIGAKSKFKVSQILKSNLPRFSLPF